MAIDADPEPENQNIARWMANGYTLVFRPQWSGGGEGVFFLSRDDEAWRINGHSATRAAGPQQGGGNRFGQRHWQETDSPWLGLRSGRPLRQGPQPRPAANLSPLPPRQVPTRAENGSIATR